MLVHTKVGRWGEVLVERGSVTFGSSHHVAWYESPQLNILSTRDRKEFGDTATAAQPNKVGMRCQQEGSMLVHTKVGTPQLRRPTVMNFTIIMPGAAYINSCV
jgi:hypothetical protein